MESINTPPENSLFNPLQEIQTPQGEKTPLLGGVSAPTIVIAVIIGIFLTIFYQYSKIKKIDSENQKTVEAHIFISPSVGVQTPIAQSQQKVKFNNEGTRLKLSFSSGKNIELNLSQLNTIVNKVNADTYEIAPIKISYYQNLPKSISEDTSKDSDGTIAGGGCHFERNPISVNGTIFNRQICYYNTLGVTLSGKYDAASSQQLSISCIYSYLDNRGFVVFEPIPPIAPVFDSCEIIKTFGEIGFN